MNVVEGWIKSDLLSLLQVMKSGGTPDTSNEKYYGGNIPFVSIEDMTASKKYLFNTIKTITEEGLKNSNTWIVPENSLLYSIYATLGVPVINAKPVATNQAILSMIIKKDKISLDYLYYWLEYIKGSVFNLSSQTTQSNLSAGIVKTFLIHHPTDINEQTKIAEVLSSIDKAIEQTEAIIAKQQRIKTGLIQDLLSKGIDEHGNIRNEQTHAFKDSPLGRIPVEWDVLPLDKLAFVLDPNPSHRNPIYIEDGYPFISTVEFIEPDGVEINTTRRVNEQTVLEQEKRCLFCNNSIGFSRKGTIGKTRLLPTNIRFALLDSLCVINAKEGINSNFINLILNSQPLKRQIAGSTMGVALPQMSIGRVRELLIPIPKDLDEQINIVNKIESLFTHEKQLWNQVIKMRRLKTALMQDLFTGKVRVNQLL